MSENPAHATPTSARTAVRRGSKRAVYERAALAEILRAGTVAHVGVMTDDGPLVLPMVYGISDDTMYLHGAVANSLLGSSVGAEVCATVTIVDGLVFAKTPFNHSMNYRSVVVRGRARLVVDEAETLRALRLMTDHIVATWDATRDPSPSEIRATKVIALPLAEMSGKVRTGAAVNDADDADAPYWSGYIPISARFGEPSTNDDSVGDIPDVVRALTGSDVHTRPAAEK